MSSNQTTSSLFISYENDYEWDVNLDNTVTIRKFKGNAITQPIPNTIRIPYTLDNKIVTIIGDYAFQNNTNINSVIIHSDIIENENMQIDDDIDYTDTPSDMLCPITCEIMKDPVICSDGNTYERKAIERWLLTNNKSPSTNLPLINKTLIPNVFAKRVIETYKEAKLKEQREYDML
jgi:hypothetical protein